MSRLKILTNLNTAERPQDRRARLRIADRDYDLRVATMPTIHGEGIAIRLLSSNTQAPELTRLGLAAPDLDRLQRPPAIAVLNALSDALPREVWLEDLSLDDWQVEFRGRGSGIPALIGALEQSPLFRNVDFAAATQFEADRNAEAFAIRAALEPAPPERAVP